MVRGNMKVDEWRTLNLAAAVIYAQMGNAMTWAVRADFALECYEKAMPYAHASGDAKIISLARKRVDEFRELNNRNSSNWLWWTIGAIVVVYLLS